VSALWWAGAEALDDLADGALSGAAALTALPAGVANLVLLPCTYLRSVRLPSQLVEEWIHDFVESCLLAAEGQLVDTGGGDLWQSRPAVLAGYLGKTSAAYARDAGMATRAVLTGQTPVDPRGDEEILPGARWRAGPPTGSRSRTGSGARPGRRGSPARWRGESCRCRAG
jgi:hypothetical protein